MGEGGGCDWHRSKIDSLLRSSVGADRVDPGVNLLNPILPQSSLLGSTDNMVPSSSDFG